MDEIRYLISDASKKVDVENHVLRYWEEELGLSIPRNEMGHRYYTEFHIRLFCQVKKLKDKGYQLKAIKSALQQVMDQNQGVLEAANVLEQDMSRTLQEDQHIRALGPFLMDNPSEKISTNEDKKAENFIENTAVTDTHLTDYNRLEPGHNTEKTGRKKDIQMILATSANEEDTGALTASADKKSQTSQISSDNLSNQIDYKNTSDKPDSTNPFNQPIQTILLFPPEKNRKSGNEVRAEEVQPEIQSNAQDKIQNEVQSEIQNKVQNVMQDEVQNEVQSEMQSKERNVMQNEMQNETQSEVQNKPESRIQNGMQSEIQREMSAETQGNNQEEAERKIQEIGEKDGQADMKKRGRDRKKPSAWERRNGMVAGAGEGGTVKKAMTGRWQDREQEDIQDGAIEDTRLEEDEREAESAGLAPAQYAITEEMAREMLRLIDARRRADNIEASEGEETAANQGSPEGVEKTSGEEKESGKGEASKRKEAAVPREVSKNEREGVNEGTTVGEPRKAAGSLQRSKASELLKSSQRSKSSELSQMQPSSELQSSSQMQPSSEPAGSLESTDFFESTGQAELALMTQDEKMEQFQLIMNHIIERALAVNNEKLSQDISGLVNRKLSEELEDLMRIRDEREEERYRQIDEIIRSCQRDSQSKAEAAATRVPFFKRRHFGRSGKHLK